MPSSIKKSVLVVDGADSIFRLLMIILGRLDYQVYHSISGSEALGEARMKLPDLIISEINLQDGSGLDLFHALRSNHSTSTTPFIILTTDSDPSLRERAMQAGVQAYLSKPLNVRALYHALEDHLEHRRRRYIRLNLSLLVNLHDGQDKMAFQTHTFGEGGLFVKTSNPLPVGTKVDLLVHLPEREPPVPLRGEVIHSVLPPVRVGHPGMGMKFIDVPLQARNLLSAFMEAVLTDPTGIWSGGLRPVPVLS